MARHLWVFTRHDEFELQTPTVPVSGPGFHLRPVSGARRGSILHQEKDQTAQGQQREVRSVGASPLPAAAARGSSCVAPDPLGAAAAAATAGASESGRSGDPVERPSRLQFCLGAASARLAASSATPAGLAPSSTAGLATSTSTTGLAASPAAVSAAAINDICGCRAHAESRRRRPAVRSGSQAPASTLAGVRVRGAVPLRTVRHGPAGQQGPLVTEPSFDA